MFDVFVAEMRCSTCGQLIPINADIGMQTHIRGDGDGTMLGVGFVFEPVALTTKHILGAGYALIAEPLTGGTIRLLDLWGCPVCQTEQWSMVTIADRQITTIEPVPLTRSTLEAANFISDINAELAAQQLTGSSEPYPDRATGVSVLRQHLP